MYWQVNFKILLLVVILWFDSYVQPLSYLSKYIHIISRSTVLIEYHRRRVRTNGVLIVITVVYCQSIRMQFRCSSLIVITSSISVYIYGA